LSELRRVAFTGQRLREPCMIHSKQDKTGALAFPASAVADEKLPYRIELWDADDPDCIERVLARAFSAALGRAIFKAARVEHPDRRITLSRGKRLVADSAEWPRGPSRTPGPISR
jgi:hypothetical protein